MKLSDIAKIINCNFTGGDFEVSGLNTLRDAKKSEVSFVANSKYVNEIEHSNAGAIIVQSSLREFVPKSSIALVVDAPYWEIATLSKYFAPIVSISLPRGEYAYDETTGGSSTSVLPFLINSS